MSVVPQTDLVGGLLRIHAVITRALEVTAEYCSAAAGPDVSSPSVHEEFFTYVEALGAVLHGHHTTEDELTFPYLRERIPDLPYDRLTAEHQQVAAAVQEIADAIAAGRSGDREGGKQAVGRSLTRISQVWGRHIADEERFITPERIDATVSVEEQQRLVDRIAEHMRTHATPDYLAMPFVLYNLPPSERAAMAAMLPPVVTQQLVPIVWADKWRPMKRFLLPD